MAKTEQSIVNDWLLIIRVACDPESPFAGLVDLTEIFRLPLETQQKIHAALEPHQLELMRKYYGEPAHG